MIIDFHSHILPGMDDGAQHLNVSLEMLSAMRDSGVEKVIATSHFYPEDEAPDAFLRRRAKSIRRLLEGLSPELHPAVLVGAEVAYYPGISRSEQLASLCIAGTPLLLVEMPFSRWSEGVTEELYAIREQRRLVPVVAHYERYIGYQKRGTLEELVAHDILIQSNADNFTDKHSQKEALRLLDRQLIHILGSDAHNTTTRAPNLTEAIAVIAEKTDGRMLAQIQAFTERILRRAKPVTELVLPEETEE